MQVRITATPPGEAPEHVRQAWVGLVLPVAATASGPIAATGYGVLSGRPFGGPLRRLWNRLTGRAARHHQYPVPVDAALAILARTAPAAAAWWREHTPHLVGVGGYFGFAARVCEEVHGADRETGVVSGPVRGVRGR
ncbi:hypothetical protein [Frigoriglobus tundricola]|uniref:Uncharacterized protein n=1 Tax=Frigoriglobus tundricola TaxID=2774151 RepID=A0A6M5YV03_9BACT|nr:hypothetical protein [Frigoriglobus tundricola]QJW97759.1 hypothetical protein FTUN_5337 [Frigoriglobus tundricola]